MKKIEIDHFKHYKFISMLRSNGKGIVSFLHKQADLEENRYNSDLWLWKNGKATQLTAGGTVNTYWWRNEREIVFPRKSTKGDESTEPQLPRTELYSISAVEAGEALPFLSLDYEVEDIAFLTDTRFLFMANYDATTEKIRQAPQGDTGVAADMLREEQVCTISDELPIWNNGEGFAGGKRHRLYLYEDGETRPLVDDKTSAEQLRLSPTGRYAYFFAQRYDTVEPVYNQLMRLDTRTLEVEDISFELEFRHHSYAVLNDDTLVVFGTDMQEYGINQIGNFYRLEVPQRTTKLLYDGGMYDNWDSVGSDLKLSAAPRWAAHGNSVYWTTTIGGSSHLMCIDASTGEIQQLTHTNGAVMEFALCDGQLYFSALRALEGPELYLLGQGKKETCLTTFNAQLSKEYALSVPEPLSYTNKEGTEIYGWVMKPVGFEGGKQYPAILNIHGGPKTVYGPVVFHEMQYWANQGFGVLFCNPTGSDGRGNAFADIRGKYGTVDYDDIMGFVDAVLTANPWIDAGRVGVTGGSYGGYMTNWIIGHTNRFAAAASQRSISNCISMAYTSDIGWYFEPDQTGTDAWADAAELWKQSPLKYADKVKTPTLFIHSDEDYRCYMAEALQMYTALQVFNVPTRLCLFHGENHELSRSGKPKARIRRLREITEWFARYLKQDD